MVERVEKGDMVLVKECKEGPSTLEALRDRYLGGSFCIILSVYLLIFISKPR